MITNETWQLFFLLAAPARDFCFQIFLLPSLFPHFSFRFAPDGRRKEKTSTIEHHFSNNLRNGGGQRSEKKARIEYSVRTFTYSLVLSLGLHAWFRKIPIKRILVKNEEKKDDLKYFIWQVWKDNKSISMTKKSSLVFCLLHTLTMRFIDACFFLPSESIHNCLPRVFISLRVFLFFYVFCYAKQNFWVAKKRKKKWEEEWKKRSRNKVSRTKLEICHIFLFTRGRKSVRSVGREKRQVIWKEVACCAKLTQKSMLSHNSERRYSNPVPFHFVINCQLVCVVYVSIYRRLKVVQIQEKKKKDVKIDFHFVIVAGIFCPISNIHKIFTS